jgi:hypothetical protein
MRRWKRFLALSGLLVVAILFAAHWTAHVTMLENFDRVEPGMTRAEVYALLGTPENDSSGELAAFWHLGTQFLCVNFDPQSGQVLAKSTGYDRVSVIDKMCDSITRQWREWFP